MSLKDIGDFIGSIGFPAFVAVFVLMRLEPAVERLEKAITSLMVVTAKSNGMKGEDVAEIVKAVAKDRHHRRANDKVDN